MPCKWYNLGYCEWHENRCEDISNIECELRELVEMNKLEKEGKS